MWNIDALHSQIFVAVWHFNVAYLRAKFPGVTGGLEVDGSDPLRSRFEATIEAASVLTGHPPQEEFMRSEAWLDAERHPYIKFAGTGIEPREGGFNAHGELTLRGVRKEVEIPFDFHPVIHDPWGLRAGVTGELKIDRRDFGIRWDRIFTWGLMAAHELTLSLDIELVYPDASLAETPEQVG
jgi:polyisoprenoid-binding protein YceI